MDIEWIILLWYDLKTLMTCTFFLFFNLHWQIFSMIHCLSFDEKYLSTIKTRQSKNVTTFEFKTRYRWFFFFVCLHTYFLNDTFYGRLWEYIVNYFAFLINCIDELASSYFGELCIYLSTVKTRQSIKLSGDFIFFCCHTILNQIHTGVFFNLFKVS